MPRVELNPLICQHSAESGGFFPRVVFSMEFWRDVVGFTRKVDIEITRLITTVSNVKGSQFELGKL